MQSAMTTTPAPTVEQRLARLERQNRRWKQIALIPALLLAVVCLTGAVKQYQDGIEVAARGVRQGWFGFTNDGGINLNMLGQKGQDIIYLGQSDQWSPMLMLYNRKGQMTAELSVDYKSGMPVLQVMDPRGNSRMRLDVEEGRPALAFYGPKGGNRMLLTSKGLSFYDEHGNELPSSVMAQ